MGLPIEGLERPAVIRYLRRAAEDLRHARCPGSWMIVEGGEAIGLCSYKNPPGPARTVEIGYGVIAERRGQGHATRAVAQMLDAARGDPRIAVLTAETAADNIASQRVLERNGFRQVGWRTDEEGGDLYLWRIELAGF